MFLSEFLGEFLRKFRGSFWVLQWEDGLSINQVNPLVQNR